LVANRGVFRGEPQQGVVGVPARYGEVCRNPRVALIEGGEGMVRPESAQVYRNKKSIAYIHVRIGGPAPTLGLDEGGGAALANLDGEDIYASVWPLPAEHVGLGGEVEPNRTRDGEFARGLGTHFGKPKPLGAAATSQFRLPDFPAKVLE